MAGFTPLQTVVGGEGDKSSDFNPIREIEVGQAPKRNALAAGLSSGLDDLQGLGYSTGAAIADVVGADSAKEWLNEQARRNQIESRLNGRPDLERIEDQSVRSALPYLVYQGAKQVPNVVGGITMGALVPEAAVPAALSRGASILPKALGGGGLSSGALEAAEGYAAKKALVKGAEAAGETFGKQVLGGLAFNEGQAVGALYQEAKDNPEDKHPGLTALGLSPAYALMETLPEAMLAGRFAHGSGFSGNLLSRTAKSAGVQAASGVASEIGQTAMELGVGASKSADEIQSQFLNAGVAGGLVEGMFGLAGGHRTKAPAPGTPNKKVSDFSAGGEVGQAMLSTPAGTTPVTGLAPASDSQVSPQAPAPTAAAPIVSGGTTPIAQAQAAAQQEQIATETALREQANREKALSTVGAVPVEGPTGPGVQVFGQSIFGPQVAQFGTALSTAVNALPEQGAEIVKAIAEAHVETGNKLVSFNYNGNPVSAARSLVKTLSKVADKFQIGHAESVEQAAAILDEQSKTAKGDKLEQINAIHFALTGEDTTGFLEANNQPKKGANDGQLQVQQQNPAGLGTVREQGGAGEAGAGVPGDVQPSGVQPVQSGSQSEGSLGLQVGQPAGAGVRDGSGGVPDAGSGDAQAPQVSPTQELANEQGQGTQTIESGGEPVAQGEADQTGGSGVPAVDQPRAATGEEVDSDQPYESEDLSHVPVGYRRKVRRSLIAKVLAPKQERSNTLSLSQRILMVEGVLIHGETLEQVAAQIKALPGTVGTALNRLGIKLQPHLTKAQRGEKESIEARLGIAPEMAAELDVLPKGDRTAARRAAVIADLPIERVAKDLARLEEIDNSASKIYVADEFGAELQKAAAEFRSEVFPHGLTPAMFASLFAAERRVHTMDTITEQQALEFENSTTEQRSNAGFGAIKTAGGSQSSVESEDKAFFARVENLTKAMASAKTEEERADAQKKLEAEWTKYNKKQQNRSKQSVAEELGDAEEEAAASEDTAPDMELADRAADAWAEFAPKDAPLFSQLPTEIQDAFIEAGEDAWNKKLVKELAAQYEDEANGGSTPAEAKPKKAKTTAKAKKEKAAEQLDADKSAEQKAEAAKLRAAVEAKTREERKGLAVGDTVVNPKLGTGEVLSFAGNGDSTTVTVKFKNGQTKELSVAVAKLEKIDAVQEQSAGEVDVRQPASNGETVGAGNAKPEGAAGKGEAQGEAIRTPQEQYEALTAGFPAPAWDSLTEKQRGQVTDLAHRDELNLSALNNLLSGAPVKFGKGAKVTNPYTAKELLAELTKFLRTDTLGRKIWIVDRIDQLPSWMAAEVEAATKEGSPFGWANGEHAVLIASRIEKGQGRSKFIHEVGGHLGLDKLLPNKLHQRLVAQLRSWKTRADDSVESMLAARAWARVEAAQTVAADQGSEFLAYFLEEALLAGIDPTAEIKQGSSELRQWFRTLWAAFKVAIRRLGFKPDSLTAQDVVDLAYGAARLEIAGTWHGTAAQFRKFNHGYIGAGEGAQVFGWGTYLAQRFGVAQGYWKDDVRRKTVKGGEISFGNGKPLRLTNYDMRSFLSNSGILSSTFANMAVLASDWEAKLDAQGKEAESVLEKRKELAPKLEALEAEYERLKAKFQAHKDSPDYNRATSYAEEMAALKAQGAVLQLQSSMPGDFAVEQAEKKLQLVKEVRALGGFKHQTASKPDGMLMRVDTALTPEDTIDYDTPLSKQNENVKEIMRGILEPINDEIVERQNLDWDELTGEDLFGKSNHSLGLLGMLISDDVIQDWDADPATKKAVEAGELHKAASLYLLSKGIRGIEFYDGDSRAVGNIVKSKLDRAAEALEDAQHDLEMGQGDERNVADAQRAYIEAEEEHRKIGKNYVVFDDKDIFRVGGQIAADKQRIKFGSNASIEGAGIPTQEQVSAAIAKMPSQLQGSTNRFWKTLFKNAALPLMITEDLVKLASKFMKAAPAYMDAQFKRAAKRQEIELKVDKIIERFEKLDAAAQKLVNEYIYDSTLNQKWGYYPGEHRVGTTLFEVDPDYEERFDAIEAKSPEAAQLIQDVFDHGYDMLKMKQQAVDAAIDREFKAREDAAMGDPDELAKIAKEKRLIQKREMALRNLDVDKPYAYLGRHGDYVVVAKSKEFIAAEEIAKGERSYASGDSIFGDPQQAQNWLQENVSNPDHYVVQFAETQGEADKIAAELIATGKYDLQAVDAGPKEANGSYSGGDAFLAVKRLQNMADRQGTDDATLQKLLSDLYLATVSEASARKSELQRKYVAGADKNMMRNLATAGRADAHFVSTAMYNDEIVDSLEQMRSQAVQRRRDAMDMYNELYARYANGMQYKTPAPLVRAATQTSSVYYLSTNPAFYLQQILQTAVLSLPFMSGRLGYFRSIRALNSAYKDVAGLVKGLSITDHVDFSKAPGDVRAMLQTLVGMGKIDIGIDADTKSRAGEHGTMGKVLRKLQGVNTRIEAINRATAAIAAYRGYLQRYGANKTAEATKYAAEVVSNTHGSYDGFNTPRALDNDYGRFFLQFKRFQIIQLSMLAKLLHGAFKGASPEEKAVARKTLGFITAHMAVLGGALGVPFVSQLGQALLSAFGDDDEPDDLEQYLRNAIDDKAIADLLLRGVPSAVGLESLGKKLAMENVASVLPFTDVDLSSRSGMEKVLVGLMGPTAGLGLKMADAFGMMGQGELYKGMELMLPTGLSNALKGARFASEGVTMRNGDTVMGPEEVSLLDAAFQAVGLPTNTITDRQRLQKVVADTGKFFESRAGEVKHDYVKAFRDGDSAAMQDARDAWAELQDSRQRNGYARQPLSTLFKAPAEAGKRERNVAGGVEFNKNNRRFVERVANQ